MKTKVLSIYNHLDQATGFNFEFVAGCLLGLNLVIVLTIALFTN